MKTLARRDVERIQPLEPRQRSLLPSFGGKWQLVKLLPRFPPRREVRRKQFDKTLAMGRLDQVEHLVNYDVLKQIPRLLYELRI